jgi:hypothetical protein
VKGRPGPTPWRRMMSSPPILAIVTNNFAFHYAFYVIMNWLPTYFNRCVWCLLARAVGQATCSSAGMTRSTTLVIGCLRCAF